MVAKQCFLTALAPYNEYNIGDVSELSRAYFFGGSVGALEEPGLGEDQQLEGVLDSAEVTDVDHGQTVQLVQAGVLKPEDKGSIIVIESRHNRTVAAYYLSVVKQIGHHHPCNVYSTCLVLSTNCELLNTIDLTSH